MLVARFVIGEFFPFALPVFALAKSAFKSIYASIRSACNMPFQERAHAFSTYLKEAKKPAARARGGLAFVNLLVAVFWR